MTKYVQIKSLKSILIANKGLQKKKQKKKQGNILLILQAKVMPNHKENKVTKKKICRILKKII